MRKLITRIPMYIVVPLAMILIAGCTKRHIDESPDYPEKFLFVVKIIGFFVAAAGGLLGVVSKTHGEGEDAPIEPEGVAGLLSRLNVRGKKLFWITAIAVAITLVAQILELFQQEEQAKQLLTNTANLLISATNQLNLSAQNLGRSEQQLSNSQVALDLSSKQILQANDILSNLVVQGKKTEVILTNVTQQSESATNELALSFTVLTQQFEQVKMSKQALEDIQRIGTRFSDKLSVQATFELPVNDPLSKKIMARLLKARNNEWPSNPAPYLWNYGYDVPIDVLSRLFPTNAIDVHFLLKFLKLSDVVVGLNKESLIEQREYMVGEYVSFYDLEAPRRAVISQNNYPAEEIKERDLQYYVQENMLLFHLVAEISKTNWFSNQTITSIHDLSKTYCNVYLIYPAIVDSDPTTDETGAPLDGVNRASIVWANARPKYLKLKFDDYPAIELNSFTGLAIQSPNTWDTNLTWEAVLPTEKEILNGSVSMPHDIKKETKP